MPAAVGFQFQAAGVVDDDVNDDQEEEDADEPDGGAGAAAGRLVCRGRAAVVGHEA